MKGHSTSRLCCKASKSHVEIDKKIVSMCKLLWELGLKTNCSCENFHDLNYVWIEFAGEKSLTKFLQIVLKNELMEEESDVAVRALGGSNTFNKSEYHPHVRQVELDNGLSVSYKFDMPKGGNQWGYCLTPHIHAPRPENEIIFVNTLASVFIPITDYKFVCDKLKQHIKRRGSKKS
jgi:hypothetical protein